MRDLTFSDRVFSLISNKYTSFSFQLVDMGKCVYEDSCPSDKNRDGWVNRPLALRGHVINASSKQWVGILLMPKIDRTHKNYLTSEIWDGTLLREIFYGTWFFNKVVWIVLAPCWRANSCPLTWRPKRRFWLMLVLTKPTLWKNYFSPLWTSFQPWSPNVNKR